MIYDKLLVITIHLLSHSSPYSSPPSRIVRARCCGIIVSRSCTIRVSSRRRWSTTSSPRTWWALKYQSRLSRADPGRTHRSAHRSFPVLFEYPSATLVLMEPRARIQLVRQRTGARIVHQPGHVHPPNVKGKQRQPIRRDRPQRIAGNLGRKGFFPLGIVHWWRVVGHQS